jgi:hypothetical protein
MCGPVSSFDTATSYHESEHFNKPTITANLQPSDGKIFTSMSVIFGTGGCSGKELMTVT